MVHSIVHTHRAVGRSTNLRGGGQLGGELEVKELGAKMGGQWPITPAPMVPPALHYETHIVLDKIRNKYKVSINLLLVHTYF